MRLSLRFALALSLCALTATAASAEVAPPTIDVEGVVEIEIAPNQATVRLGVETFHTHDARAIADNDTRTEAVLKAIKTHGVAARDRQTDVIRVDEGNHRYKRQTAQFGTLVTRTITVTVRDLTTLEALLRSALKAGATDIHSVTFGHSEINTYKQTARLEAVKAAKAKAQAMAAAIGQGIGPARHLTDNPRGSGWGVTAPSYANVFVNAGGQSVSGDTIAAGTIRIKMTIGATFALTEK